MAPARRFSELVCWQLSDGLKLAVYEICRRPDVLRDLRFCSQFRDAAASAPRNIAEGFGRRTHKDFAHFLDVTRGSLHECEQHLKDAVDRGYLTSAESAALVSLARRAGGATAGLQRYLRSTPDVPPQKPQRGR
jgi:four helix bundle protein